MKSYTQLELDALIHCRKVITEPPRKELRTERGSRRSDLKLQSEDGAHDFAVFIRVNVDFPENFSVGLEYLPRDERGSVCLLRCNGPHGEYLGEAAVAPAHFRPHIHVALAENLAAGLRAERGGSRTMEFGSYPEALAYFLGVVNIQGAATYFASTLQMPLDLDQEENER